MENLLGTVKELQRERNNLEKTLQEQRQQRQSLENKAEQVKEKYSEVQLKHKKASDAFAVAQHNVDLTHTSSIRLQEDLDRSISKVNCLQQATEKEKKIQISQMQYFQTTLEQISTELFNAKNFYKKSSLNNEMNSATKELANINLTLEVDKGEIMELERFLEKIRQESDDAGNKGLESILNICLRAIERDFEEAQLFLSKVRIEIKEVQALLHCSPSKQSIFQEDTNNNPGHADSENINAISKLSICS